MRLAGLHPEVADRARYALDIADYYDVPVTVTSGHRSWAEQQRLYTNYRQCVAEGRFGTGPDCLYPANRPGDSSHNWGLAWDSTVPDWAQDWWDRVREWLGFEVLPNDRIHAQVPNWRQYVDQSRAPRVASR